MKNRLIFTNSSNSQLNKLNFNLLTKTLKIIVQYKI